METVLKNTRKEEKKSTRKKISRIKLEYDKELEVLSATILFPEKLESANKFLGKSR